METAQPFKYRIRIITVTAHDRKGGRFHRCNIAFKWIISCGGEPEARKAIKNNLLYHCLPSIFIIKMAATMESNTSDKFAIRRYI